MPAARQFASEGRTGGSVSSRPAIRARGRPSSPRASRSDGPASRSVAGFGLAGEHEKEWLMRREALKVSAAMFPEYVGLRCIDGVIKLYNGQPVPERDVIPTVPMTAEMLEKYYPKKDGVWTPDFEAIAAIPAKSDCTKV